MVVHRGEKISNRRLQQSAGLWIWSSPRINREYNRLVWSKPAKVKLGICREFLITDHALSQGIVSACNDRIMATESNLSYLNTNVPSGLEIETTQPRNWGIKMASADRRRRSSLILACFRLVICQLCWPAWCNRLVGPRYCQATCAADLNSSRLFSITFRKRSF